MERFFRSLKTENMPRKGYSRADVASDFVRDYICRHQHSMRPHSHNFGLSPNEKEAFFWKADNAVAKKS
ncbi:MAG: putative transposase [Cellvibrionaceae bacterium]|jgi:putative transposase